MLVGSMLLGLSEISTPHKELGYFYEINWSLNYLIVIPTALYFCSSTINGIPDTLRSLVRAHMIVRGDDGRPIEADEAITKWHEYGRFAMTASIVLIVFSLAVSLREWNLACRFPLGFSTLTMIPAADRPLPGWSLAAILDPHVSRKANIWFGLAAYLTQGFVAGLFLSYVCIVIAFASLVYSYTTSSTSAELLPDVLSVDSRRGFDRFESLIENLLCSTIAFFGVFFLTRLDHLFLYSSQESILVFLKDSIAQGFFTGIKEIFTKGNPQLFEAGGNLDPSTVLVGAAAFVMVVTAFLIPASILRQAAARSRDRFKDFVSDPGSSIKSPAGISIEECEKRLDSMAIWPLRYPKPVQLLGIAAVALGSFVFYRLTLLFVGSLFAYGLRQVYRVFSDQE